MAAQGPKIRNDAQRSLAWRQQAASNVETWGQQDAVPLVLAKIEELGELAEVLLDVVEFEETQTAWFTENRLKAMVDLGDAVQGFLEQTSEDLDGQPIPPEERPTLGTLDEATDAQLEALRDELADDAALSFQLAWALDAVDGGGA